MAIFQEQSHYSYMDRQSNSFTFFDKKKFGETLATAFFETGLCWHLKSNEICAGDLNLMKDKYRVMLPY